jgi:YbbR domain-containing protein
MFRPDFRNFNQFLLSLLLAALVWLGAVNQEDPIVTQVFPRSVPIKLIEPANNLKVQEKSVTEANITLRGPQSLLKTLTISQLSVQADLSQLAEGSTLVDLSASIDMEGVKITAVTPPQMRVVLVGLLERTLPIRVDLLGEPAIGYQSGNVSYSTNSVVVSGLLEDVNRVSEIRVDVDLAGRKDTLSRDYPLVGLDSEGEVVDGVELNPKSLNVNIPIVQLERYRELAVKANIQGTLPNGYLITGITYSPQTVTVYSNDLDLVANLPSFLETVPIDISTATDDMEVNVALRLPSGLSLVNEAEVLVQISIAAITNSVTVTKEIEVVGLAPGLVANLTPSEVDVILTGPAPILSRLPSNALRVRLDLAKLDVGTYVLPIVVVLERDDVTAQLVTLSAKVEITRLPTPTPTRRP